MPSSADSDPGRRWLSRTLEGPPLTLAIHPRDRGSFRALWPSLRADLERHRPDVLVLIPHRRVPTRGHKRHTRIRSFGLADDRAMEGLRRDAPPEEWAYRACRDALHQGWEGRAPRFLVRELPPRDWRRRWQAWRDARRTRARRLVLPSDPQAGDVTALVAIPHAGPLGPLDSLLELLTTSAPEGVRIAVGFDEGPGPEHRRLVERYPSVDFWAVDPPGGGPYVIREFLARRATEPWIVFQDSDDVPCVDRLATLLSAVRERPVDVLGSWELQVNERRRRLTAVRFPVDASAAIRSDGETAQLHPTTIANTRALRRMGGFSTAHRFAADREIQLRSAFDFDLRNLDRVLYVRSRRTGTLSTAPDSGMRSAARAELRERWHEAYLKIRDGGVPIAAGGLGPVHRDAELRFTHLGSGESVSTRFDPPDAPDPTNPSRGD